jgi:hypothetical protein
MEAFKNNRRFKNKTSYGVAEGKSLMPSMPVEMSEANPNILGLSL